MIHIFRVLTAIALLAAMGMGCMGAVGAQENATATETANESIDWPTDSANVTVQDTRDALEERPTDLPTETVEAIVTWTSDPDNLAELGASEREQATDWVLEARSLEAIDRSDLPDVPDLPDLPSQDQSDTGGDDQTEQANSTDTDQDDLEANDSEPEVSTNGTAAGLENQERIEFNENTRIVGWEFRDGQVVVALETDRRTGVTISDALAGIGEDGAVQVPETSQFLERNQVTTVRMDVTAFQGGHSVGVTVDGLTVRLSSEMDESDDDNPLRYFGGEQGLFTGMIMSIVMSGAATGFVLWREESGVIRA